MNDEILDICTEIAEKISNLNVGDGYQQGFDDGKKAEYDAFWDAYQQNGKREAYAFAFAGRGWNAETFKPKYDIVVKGTARSMFASGLAGVDLEQLLLDLGITLDTSGVTSTDGFDYFCEYASPSVFPVIDTTGAAQVRRLFFHSPSVVTVRKVILKDDGSQTFTAAFENNTKLENIEFEGVFGNNVDFGRCSKLTKASLTSIMQHLSTTATFTVTLSQTAVNNAFETSEGAADGSESAEWLALVNERPNVTISLV
jgi:hypothetical protein